MVIQVHFSDKIDNPSKSVLSPKTLWYREGKEVMYEQ